MPLGKSIILSPYVFNLETFCTNACENTNTGLSISERTKDLYKLKCHVNALNIGVTQLDCSIYSIRMGADKVTVAFRRGFDYLRANIVVFDPSIYEWFNFTPFSNRIRRLLLMDN